jgi:hypothetical protein
VKNRAANMAADIGFFLHAVGAGMRAGSLLLSGAGRYGAALRRHGQGRATCPARN